MREGESVKDAESSAFMYGVSTPSSTRSGLLTLDSSQRIKYKRTNCASDGHTASH